MKILLTGGKGQVGSEFTEYVEQNPELGVELLITDLHNLDISNRDQVRATVAEFEPQWIVHLAALTAVDLCEDQVDLAFSVNAIGTRNLVQAADAVGAKVCYISTDYVFDGESSTPYREWDTPNPKSVYGKSKLAGELEVRPTDLIIRTSWVMGKYGSNILKTMIRLARGEGEVKFVGDQIGSPTVVSDLIRTIVDLITRDQSGLFHACNEGSLSWFELCRFVFQEVGADPNRVVEISSDQLDSSRKAPRPKYSVLDNMAIRLTKSKPLPNYRDSVAALVRTLLEG
ncbi:MAG: dTDP-4-dehydrorhamnose reductase [Actinomycetota bacterium]|nr:dTDP-4-dehydrorhamnose reductase [Actinomycetota bacterium]